MRSADRSGPSGSQPALRGPLRPLDGRVVAIHETASQGQRIEVEDQNRIRWQVDCLGEAVGHGALIRFEPMVGGSGREGVLVRVLEDERDRWVCTLRRIGAALRLAPFGGVELPDLELAAREAGRAREGDRVVVVPDREAAPGRKQKARTGRVRRASRDRGRGSTLAVCIAEVLGPAGHPDADHGAIAWKYRLPESFSRRASLEADALPEDLAPSELARRLDLRALPFVTIDPASARDHDDALCAEPAPESERAGHVERLWVAIADVAHFVVEGGFVDAEARRRGNSFYFPDRATPMLPERLSSDLCSLRPGVDRLVIAVELRLSDRGEIVDARFHEAVIRSQAKLSYEDAAERLARWGGETGKPSSDLANEGEDPTPPAWKDSLIRLARMAKRFGEARRAAGSIELELPEIEIEVDAEGRVVDVRLRTRNPAHGLVEEAMLAANRAVAAALDRAHRETIHRIHPPPDPRRLDELTRLLERHGLAPEDELDAPGAISAMLRKVRGLPSEESIHVATLRSMSQARYAARSGGHFALQFRHYLHFTSPIRRYADLAVHRELKRWLRRDGAEHPAPAAPGEPDTLARASALERLASWLSGRERVAIEAEREAAAFACCALLEGREGEHFEVEVTGVTEHGLFVRGLSPAASGLIPLRTLGRSFELDVEAETLVLAGSLRPIEVGSRLDARLLSVDGDRGRIAYALAGAPRDGRGRGFTQGVARDSERDSHSR